MPELTKAIILQRLEEKEMERRVRIPTKYRRSKEEEKEFAIDRDKLRYLSHNPAERQLR